MKLTQLLTIPLCILFSQPTACFATSITPKKVYISKIVDHPALNATTQGIIDGLKQKGYEEGKNLEIRIESAQADPRLAQQIASKYVNQNPDVVVAVGTLTAQTFAKAAAAGNVKLVFSSVTDPLKSDLVKTLQSPGNNTTGVSNYVELTPQLTLFLKLQPNLKRLGFLYNRGEANSVILKEKLEELCPKFNITLVEQTITKTADVAQNATKLAQNVDAIFISNDSTALGSLSSVIKAANEAKIPLYVSDTDAVELGATAALGPNQRDIGLQTGFVIAKILDGNDIAEQQVQFPDKTDLYLNKDAAMRAGITIPQELIQSATKVIESKAS